MSITSDIRTYADTARTQGLQVVEQTVGQAQAQINVIADQANGLIGKLTGSAKDNVSEFGAKATDAVNDLRSQAEKALNLDAIKSAVEPYLAQAKQYRTTVTERVEGVTTPVIDSVRNDKRVARVVATAESLTGVVVGTVNERVVKPVASLTGRGAKPVTKRPAAQRSATTSPATKAAAATPARATKPATTRSAPAKAPAKKAAPAKATARKTTARKTTARKTTAKKAPAKKATPSS